MSADIISSWEGVGGLSRLASREEGEESFQLALVGVGVPFQLAWLEEGEEFFQLACWVEEAELFWLQ